MALKTIADKSKLLLSVPFSFRVILELIRENYFPKVVQNALSEHCGSKVLDCTNREYLVFLKSFCFVNFVFKIIIGLLYISLPFPSSKSSHISLSVLFQIQWRIIFLFSFIIVPCTCTYQHISSQI